MGLKQFYRYVFLFLLSLFVLTGCGSSGHKKGEVTPTSTPNSTTTETPTATPSPSPTRTATPTPTTTAEITKGYLLDSPLEGVTYICDDGNKTALTNAEGMFECTQAPVTFKIGRLTLGTLTAFTADGKVYPQDLLGLSRDNFSDSRLKLLARLVQSLDDDGNIATKITITQSVRDAIANEQKFDDMSQSDVEALLSGLGKSLVAECGALKHLGANVTCGSDGGGSSNNTTETSSNSSNSQVLLGPVINATVNLYKVSNSSLLYTTTTADDNNLSKAGSFNIPNSLLDDTQYYLLEVIGGNDIDADDNGVRDNLSTVVHGTVHSVILGSLLLNGNTKVNPLSEIIYQKLKPILNSNSASDNNLIKTKINNISKLLIKKDINGDGIISEKDISLFSPKDDNDKVFFNKAKLTQIISLIHSGNEQNLSNVSNNLDFSLINYITGDNEYGGSINIKDNFLFLTNYYGMKVFDITDIFNPIQLYSTKEKVGNSIINGNYLYTGYLKTLKVFDISDKKNITLIKNIDLVNKLFRDIKIKDNYLFLVTSNSGDQTKNGVTVFDITDINNFHEISFWQAPNPEGKSFTQANPFQIILNNTSAIIIYHNTGGFDILDISNPNNISLIREIRENGDHSSTEGATINNNILYLGYYNYGMRIYDINNSSSPVKLGEIYLGYDYTQISVRGDYAYVANDSLTSLKIINITDKTKPILVTTKVLQSTIYDSKIQNNQLYLATNNGFQVINTSIDWKTNQDYISKYSYPTMNIEGIEGNVSLSFGGDIIIDNNGVAYISGDGIISLDLSEPTSPIMLDQIYSYGSKSIIKKYNDYLYTGGYQNFLEIIDASESNNLLFSLKNSYATNGGESFGLDFKNNYAYILGYDLKVIDITDHNNSTSLKTIQNVTNENGDLKVKDDYLYVASDWNSSLLVYDISNQINPILKKSISINPLDYGTKMDIIADTLYLTTSKGFELFNITNKENPSKLSLYEDSGMSYFRVNNNIAYISSSKGITILDIQTPSNPVLIGYYNIADNIGGLDIWNGYLYVTTNKELLIYPLIKNN